MKVLYCTGNAGKFREASFVIDGWNAERGETEAKVEYVQVDADPVEIQGTSEEIGARKVTEATRLLRERGAKEGIHDKSRYVKDAIEAHERDKACVEFITQLRAHVLLHHEDATVEA